MTTVRNLVFLAAAAATLPVNAATIQFFSNSTAVSPSEKNSVGNNIVIQKNSAWANPLTGSQWISYANTGDPSVPGFAAPANGTVVSFSQYFTLDATDRLTDGTVSFYADDSSSVVLNGNTLLNEASSTGNTYSTCSDTKPNCIALTTVTLPTNYLVAGQNILRFDVAQRAGSSFGLDYAGSAGAPSATPEPSTWAFMASGIIALGAGLRKRFTGSL